MTADTNLGKWDHWFAGLDEPQPFGDDTTYKLGARFLADCDLIEDWGCGRGWFRRFVPEARYRGIDGSRTPFAEEIVDLASYRSHVPGIFVRHVLEHDYRWAQILDNAVASFTERMVLVVFTPLADQTHEIAYNRNPGVPDLAFAGRDLTGRFHQATWRSRTVRSRTQYGAETVFSLTRNPGTRRR